MQADAADPAQTWTDQPSTVERFYRAWTTGEETFADRAERGKTLAPIGPCTHPDNVRYYDPSGRGPLCGHCGDLAFLPYGVIKSHSRYRRQLPPVIGAPAYVLSVPFGWLYGVYQWLMKPIPRQAYEQWWAFAIVVYVGWGMAGLGSLTPAPVTWLDWLELNSLIVVGTVVYGAMLMRWGHIQLLPRRSLTSRSRPAGALANILGSIRRGSQG